MESIQKTITTINHKQETQQKQNTNLEHKIKTNVDQIQKQNTT